MALEYPYEVTVPHAEFPLGRGKDINIACENTFYSNLPEVTISLGKWTFIGWE